jgi:hypothetical protein
VLIPIVCLNPRKKKKGHEDQTSCPFVSFVVKALTVVCRVNRHPTIFHGFPAEAQIAAAPAVARLDAPLAPAAEPVDGPQVVVAACTCYVPAAVAEPV